MPDGDIKNQILKIAKKTRASAETIYRHRNKMTSRSIAAPASFVWQEIKRDDGKTVYKINKEILKTLN